MVEEAYRGQQEKKREEEKTRTEIHSCAMVSIDSFNQSNDFLQWNVLLLNNQCVLFCSLKLPSHYEQHSNRLQVIFKGSR